MFVLVLFHDIFTNRKSWKNRIKHVDKVLKILENSQLHVKRSKCAFGIQEVEYLGHIVSREGVKVALKIFKLLQNGIFLRTPRVLEDFQVLQFISRNLLRIMHALQAH
jgi:hypothetical protein